jgi:hypothetical protein
MFNARNATATPRHTEVYGRYEKAYTLVDFVAALTFVVGSVLFFYDTEQVPATWAFLIGSICFAARPTVTVLREFHLARLPLPDDPGHRAPGGDRRPAGSESARA